MTEADRIFYHVLHCKPQKELAAVNNARECGWKATVFWFKEPPKQLGRAPRWRALMPGYVFVTGGSDYYALQNPLYVNKLLSDGELTPLRIYEDNPSMATLLGRAKENGFIESATEPLFTYDEGDMVDILKGPFEGFHAKVKAMGKKQVEVELGVFGKVTVPHNQVRKRATA